MQIDRIASRFSHVEKKVDEYAAKRLPGCRRNAFTTVIWFVVAAVGVLGNVNHVARAELPDGALHEIRFSPANRGLGGVKPGGGFSTSIGFTDFSGVGYQPVEIVFRSQFATRGDLRLNYQVVNLLSTQTPDDNRLSVDIPIFVPQGTRTRKWVRYLPKWMMGNGYEVSVSQDGVILPGYRGVVGSTTDYQNLGYGLRWEQQAVSDLALDLLLITPADLTVGESKTLNSMRLPWLFEITVPWATNHNIANFGKFPAAAMSCGTGSLPKDWRGYQRWDSIVLTKAAIAKIKAREAEWNALLGWTLCGGTLVVWDVESQAELEALFDRAVATESKLTLKQFGDLGFYQDDFDRAGIQISDSGEYFLEGVLGVNASGVTTHPGPCKPSFYGVALGAGKAIAVSGIDSQNAKFNFLLNRPKWDFYLKLLGKDVSPILRRGAEPILGTGEYRKWLVPGVARPPVYVLVTFLAIFVILVGPVAYRRTTKSGRGHLMFVIAPMLAMVTTVSMFAYSLTVDGFSTLGRIRQITWIDGATGTAGERVRETYFAPISPRAGLTFSGDAEVLSVRRRDFKPWGSRHEMVAKPLGSVAITEKVQRFSRSFLPSREQKQFVSHRPRFDVGRLTLSRTDAKEPKCQVANELDFRINDAVVRDRQGTYWQVKNLKPGESQVAVMLAEEAARSVLGNYYLDHNPVAARGSQASRGPSWGGGVMNLTTELNSNLHSGARVTEGRFEGWLRDSLQLTVELPLGFFVAVCDVTQTVPAVEGCKIENSVHYVIGTLP